MGSKKETYENCEIRIEDDIQLFINQKAIDYVHDKDNKKWLSRYLPYTEYDSLIALAKAIVSDTAEFKS